MRHVSRTHRVYLDLLCGRINLNSMIQIKYVGTTQQLADIHTKKGSFTGDRWTQLTLLVNIMTRTTFTQCNLSVPSMVVIPFFPAWAKRAGDSVAASASVKQKPVHGTGLIARTLIDQCADMWTITQYFHQNIKLEATPSVKTCVSKILKEWTTRRQVHQALVNWKRLEHQAPVAAEDPSSEKKVHLHPNTDGENYISKFDDPANFKPQSTERARISQSSIEQFMCKIGWISYQSSIFPAQRCDLESIYERLFMAFILAYQGWTNVSQEHKIWHSPCNDK